MVFDLQVARRSERERRIDAHRDDETLRRYIR